MPAKKNTTAISEPTASTRPPVDATDLPPAAVTVLAVLDPENPTTANEAVERTGLARSTVTRALAVLRDAGLATRQDGGHDGTLRIPDRWYAAPWKAEHAADGGQAAEYRDEKEVPAPQAEPDDAATDAPALSPAAQKVLDLLDSENANTISEIVERTGLARSTATKALTALLDAGLAARQDSGHDGTRPVAARWLAAPGPTDDAPADPGTEVQAADQLLEPVADEPDGEANQQAEPEAADEPALDEAAADGPAEPDTDAAHDEATATVPTAAPDEAEAADPVQTADTGSAVGRAQPDGASDTAEPEEPAAVPSPSVTDSVNGVGQPAEADAEPGPARLGKGELRAQVEAHLRDHPDREWTPTAISKVLNRSAGAINNACVKLGEAGTVATFADKPIRFQWTGGGDTDAP